MAQELKLNKEKEKLESHRSDVHVVDYVSNNLNDETGIYSAEFVWPSKDNVFLVHHLSRLVMVGKQN
jgi:hypothetical protein